MLFPVLKPLRIGGREPGSIRKKCVMIKLPESILKLDRKKFLLVMGLTMVRIPLALLFTLLYAGTQSTTLRVWVGLLILTCIELSDGLDGYFARRFRVVSEAGAMFDPYTDSLSRLIVYYTYAVNGLTGVAVPMVMAIRDVTVAYCRIILARHQVSVAALKSGKIKAVVQGVAAFVLCLSPYLIQFTGNGLLSVVSWTVIIVTAASCLEYIRAAYRALTS